MQDHLTNQNNPLKNSTKQLADALITLYTKEPFDPIEELYDQLSLYSDWFSVEPSAHPEKSYTIRYRYNTYKCIRIDITDDYTPESTNLQKKQRIINYAAQVIDEITRRCYEEFKEQWEKITPMLEGDKQFTKQNFAKLLWKERAPSTKTN